jgi:hypothetical protein
MSHGGVRWGCNSYPCNGADHFKMSKCNRCCSLIWEKSLHCTRDYTECKALLFIKKRMLCSINVAIRFRFKPHQHRRRKKYIKEIYLMLLYLLKEKFRSNPYIGNINKILYRWCKFYGLKLSCEFQLWILYAYGNGGIFWAIWKIKIDATFSMLCKTQRLSW